MGDVDVCVPGCDLNEKFLAGWEIGDEMRMWV